MKKRLFLYSLFLISSICNAGINLDADDELTKLEIIDNNYKYIDLNKATTYFKTATNNMAKMLPVQINQNIEITDVFFSPFYSVTSFRLVKNIDQTHLEFFKSDILSKEQLEDLCTASYKFNFFYANDYKYEIVYKSTNNEIITKIILDKQKCKKR